MEMFACLFIIGLSFLFHLIVYENDWVEKWYWKDDALPLTCQGRVPSIPVRCMLLS